MEEQEEARSGSSAVDGGDPPLPDQDTRLIMTIRNRINRPPGWIYSCFFCPKTFTNPQALGGHQNTHRRERDLQMKEYDVKRKARARDRLSRVHPERRLAPRHEPAFKPRYNSGLTPRSGALFGQMVMGGGPIYVPPPGYPPIFAHGPLPHIVYGPNHGFAPRFEGALPYGPSLRPQNDSEDTSAREPHPRHQLTTRNFFVKAHPEQVENRFAHQHQQNDPVNTTGDNTTRHKKVDRSDATPASTLKEADKGMHVELRLEDNMEELDLSLKL